MLTPLSASGSPAPAPTPRRPPRSLKQEHQEFILQRIEVYKNTLTREQLLEIGDEAVRELEENSAGQYLLTEGLLLEHVRSEEHTSELQSPCNLVCRPLLE